MRRSKSTAQGHKSGLPESSFPVQKYKDVQVMDNAEEGQITCGVNTGLGGNGAGQGGIVE